VSRGRIRWPGLEHIPWLYDLGCACAERFWLGEWRRWLVGEARGCTLEVGCGTGRNLPLYGPRVRVIGIDPARPSLLRARRRAPRTPLVQGSAEALPFRTGAFDTVVSGLVFCSVPEPGRGLTEVRRVLRPGGALRMIEHVRSTKPWKARLQDRLEPFWTRLTGGCHPNRDTERAVEESGFGIDGATRHAMGDLRRFAARPCGDSRGGAQAEASPRWVQ
jgi:ubiquinone/menaquinone biosynthesis C-methylase UbiE